jgi:hypothetical protein
MHYRGLAAVLVFLTLASGQSSPRTKVRVSKAPLGPDQIDIYKTFLQSYVGGLQSGVNLANTTTPLHLSSDMTKPDCLVGIDPEAVASAGQVSHLLGNEISSVGRINLVDPKHYRLADPGAAIEKGKSIDEAVRTGFSAGLLNLSEIAFSRDHDVAVMKYSFVCGRLCGNFETLFFQKVDGQWGRNTDRGCLESGNF